MADYKAAWRERTRAWAIEVLGGKCARCATTDDLDFDHVDRVTKEFDISVGIRDGYSRARLVVELAKCQLLCRLCHAEKSSEAGDDKSVDHGGGRKGKRRCPCDDCKRARREYMREWKRARRVVVAQ